MGPGEWRRDAGHEETVSRNYMPIEASGKALQKSEVNAIGKWVQVTLGSQGTLGGGEGWLSNCLAALDPDGARSMQNLPL